MTPAIASDPYWADAPSRRTSIRSRAAVGTVLRSTAAAPRPTELLTLSDAEEWARMLLISTSVSSGDRPRNVAGRIASVASVAEGRGKSIDGATVARAAPSSVVP